MDDVGRWVLFFLLSILSFLFCAVTSSLQETNETKLEKFQKEHPRYQRTIVSLQRQSLTRRVNQFHLVYLIIQAGTLSYGLFLIRTMISLPTMQIVGCFLLSILLLSCCYVLPSRLFVQKDESFLMRLFPLVQVLSLPFRPILWVIVVLGELLARLFGYQKHGDLEEVTEEEIRDMVDASGEHGAIEEEEREMIHNIFDFDDLDVEEIMTHRTDIVGLETHAKISDVVYHAINDGFSRIPIYENDIDTIKGIIYVKDLLCLVGCTSSEDFKLSDFMRKPLYVPKAKKCTDLLREFKANKAHMAVVVDDYGGTAGIVSMEDLLESIVGNIQDEYDDEQEQIVQLEEGIYLLDGTVSLDDASELLDTTFDVDEDINTVAGLITNHLGRIPADGETLTTIIHEIAFSVLLAKDNRIERVKAVKTIETDEK